MSDRLQRALDAARIRLKPGKDRTLLSTEAIDDLCAELLDQYEPELLRLYERLEAERIAREAKR